MTNTNLIERLKHLVSLDRPDKGGPYAGLAARECVTAMTEAAALIEQQEAVIGALVEALESITYSDADRFYIGMHGDSDISDEIGAALLAAKTHLEE